MKKSRILAFLMTVSMATTCFLSSTIAKYTINDSVDDSATVAKWGIQLMMSGSLFEKNYLPVADENVPVASVTSNEATVQASTGNTNNLVAPGTVGNALNISLTGTAEVDATVTMSINTDDVVLKAGTYAVLVPVAINNALDFASKTGLYKAVDVDDVTTYQVAAEYVERTQYYVLQNQVVLADDYLPVEFTATNGTGTGADAKNWKVTGTAEEVKTALLAKNGVDNGLAATYQANTDYATLNLDDVEITWAWDFENTRDDNNADTILGYLASNAATVVKLDSVSAYYTEIANEDFNLAVEFEIAITVSQVD